MALGVLGGTFDPIHLGHLILAQYALDALKINKILFVPSRIPPHKPRGGYTSCTSEKHRKSMVSLAIETNPSFSLSTVELEREGTSYTIDTIVTLKKQYKEDIYFIIGGDSLPDLPNWREIDRLLNLCTFAVGLRPNYSSSDINSLEARFGRDICENLRRYYFNTPLIGISSTEVRERRKQGKSIAYLVPSVVEKYINEHGIYL